MPIQPCRNAMKLVLLLPFCVHGWWCETSAQTGCRGHSRHFVREVSARNPFLAFADIKTSRKDDAIVVDWDSDGDLDVILRTTTELLLFESKPGGKFVRVEPNPFKGIPGNPFSSSLIGDCMPAVVDWDRDGELDLIIGAKDGIEFYHRGFDRELHQRTGADNPFQHIRTKKGGPCSDLSVADWDGDGDLDLLVSDLHLPMRYFEQVDGRLVSVDEDRNPFHHILQNSIHRRPFMVDWNGDGRLELLLMPNILERLGHAQGFFADELCSVELYERDYSQDPEILRQSLDPLLLNRGCSNFTGSGVSLADLDGDGDLDAVFGADGAPLHVFEHTPSGWRSAGPTGIDSDSIPLDAIPLDSADPSNPSFRKNLLRPVLADWDLDGDLDLALLHDNGLRGGNRYFEHQSDGTVREIKYTHLSRLNANCSMNWRVGFSFVDFDGDGAKDLVGFDRNFNVIICVRTSSGFEMVSAERDPFYWGPRQNASCFLKYGDRCPWDNDYPFGWFGIMGFPSFLDWDGDGDVDMLRINAANQALARWWERHRIVSGAGLEDGIYMWWCVFVNNQFRMLEAGQVEEPDDLFDVFGQQLQGIGKMLMCLDKMRGGQYTTRIWCIFEVFVACQRSIPTTVILPELEVGAIASLEELTHECRVDAEQAKASVQADADAIKDHIKQKHQSFEYVNRTVEHALWCEVIEFLESSKKGGAGRPSQLGPGSTSTGPPTSGPAESTMSESMATDMAAEHGKCNLQ